MTRFATVYVNSLIVVCLSICGCQPGAGTVEIWVKPKKADWDFYDSTAMNVHVGQTISFDGHRVLPGSQIKPVRNFIVHCQPEKSVEIDSDARTLTFRQTGNIKVWLIESAPAFEYQSNQPEEEWDQFSQTKVTSNTLYFAVQ